MRNHYIVNLVGASLAALILLGWVLLDYGQAISKHVNNLLSWVVYAEGSPAVADVEQTYNITQVAPAHLSVTWVDWVDELHKYILYPSVRVRAGRSQGSGTIIASIPRGDGKFDTYVLTNHHVIEGAIDIKEEWSPLQKKMLKKETRATIEVEIFKYQNTSINTGTLLIMSDIVEWNKSQDLALVKLRMDDYVQPALLLPLGDINKLRIFQSVYISGSGQGRSPFPTYGHIASLVDEIDNLPYWMLTAPSVFGNSGGGAFLADTMAFIGVPSRLMVTWAMWSPNAVYHMSYIIPISRIYGWLKETGWALVYDKTAPSHEEWLKEQDKKEKDESNH